MVIKSIPNIIITDVYSLNRLLNSPIGVSTNRENRENWAITLKLKGKTLYTVNGEIFLSDCLHPVILPKGCTYSWKCIEPGECIIIEFQADIKETSLHSFEISDNNFIIKNFNKIEKSLGMPKTYSKIECINSIYEIILFLLKSNKSEAVHPKKHSILNPAITYISENYYDSNITNDFLANLCDISTIYFRKLFESVYNMPPKKHLCNYRIDKAKDLLRSDFGTIEQVALSVGYNSIYNFSKMFKTYTGKSPREFAKDFRN